MSKTLLPFIIFVILFFYALPFPVEAISVIPGWNNHIWGPWDILVKIIAVIIMLVTATWFYLSKKGKVNLTIFAIHLLTTFPIVSIPNNPFALLLWELSYPLYSCSFL